MVVEHVFLTVPVVEIEGFSAILPRLKSNNITLNSHYETRLSGIFSFKTKTWLNNELNKNFALIYFRG